MTLVSGRAIRKRSAIGQQDFDGPGVAFRERQSLATFGCLEHAVTAAGQRLDHEAAHLFLVLNYQDRRSGSGERNAGARANEVAAKYTSHFALTSRKKSGN